MDGGGDREWNEIGKGVEGNRNGGGMRQGKGMKGNRNGGGMRQGKGMKGNREGGEEDYMNYPYIISTLFVLVWVDDG